MTQYGDIEPDIGYAWYEKEKELILTIYKWISANDGKPNHYISGKMISIETY